MCITRARAVLFERQTTKKEKLCSLKKRNKQFLYSIPLNIPISLE